MLTRLIKRYEYEDEISGARARELAVWLLSGREKILRGLDCWGACCGLRGRRVVLFGCR